MRFAGAMPTLDLTDEEHAALTRFLRDAIEADRFPMAPRLRPLKAVLAKIPPPAPKPPAPEPRGRLVPPRPARARRR